MDFGKGGKFGLIIGVILIFCAVLFIVFPWSYSLLGGPDYFNSAVIKINVPSICDFAISEMDPINGFMPQKDSCYSAYAKSKQDPIFCNKMTGNPYKRWSCFLDSSNSPQQAYKFCGTIQEKSVQGYCYGTYAVLLKNDQICKEPTMDGVRALCYTEVFINAKNPDPVICDNEFLLSEDKDNCYSTIAVKTKNIPLCGKITTFNGVNFCRQLISP